MHDGRHSKRKLPACSRSAASLFVRCGAGSYTVTILLLLLSNPLGEMLR